jgi:alpha-glucosidase
MPWTVDGPSLGFGDAEPWLPQPPAYRDLAVEVQANDPTSTLSLYRTALRLRSELLVSDEEVRLLDLGSDVLAFERGAGVRCVANMGSSPIPLPPGEVLLASEDLPPGELPGDTTVWLRARP